MFIFLLIYILVFIFAVYKILKGETDGGLIFIIFGLPIYITTLSVATLYNLRDWVPFLQGFKEIVILLSLISVVYSLKKKPKLYLIDWLYLAYLSYIILYVLLPIGEHGFKDKLIALKNVSFFTLIYFTGRFFDLSKIVLSKYFNLMCLVAIPAAIIVLIEAVTYTHFQTITGYADYMFYFFNQEPSGHHGLNWTFEAENDGPKRFASFFANPLDHAAGTLVCISAILALITTNTQKLKLNKFLTIALICSFCSIIFALSRASLASYLIIIFVYANITNRKKWLSLFYLFVTLAAVFAFTFLSGDLYDFLIGTLNFSNSSSAYHIIQWAEGLQAIVSHPLGLGLGASGRISAVLGNNIGGENQLIIIAVQAGVIALGLYIAIYVSMIKLALKMTRERKGRAKKIALFILLIKLGMIIPFLTAEAESYIYIGYITAFFSGIMINIKYNSDGDRSRHKRPAIGEDGTENHAGGTLQTI
jgi:O-antigen ligase